MPVLPEPELQDLPPLVDPRWLTSTVLDLAKFIRAECCYERLPILADALMDAGCDCEPLLDGCRTYKVRAGRAPWPAQVIYGAAYNGVGVHDAICQHPDAYLPRLAFARRLLEIGNLQDQDFARAVICQCASREELRSLYAGGLDTIGVALLAGFACDLLTPRLADTYFWSRLRGRVELGNVRYERNTSNTVVQSAVVTPRPGAFRDWLEGFAVGPDWWTWRFEGGFIEDIMLPLEHGLLLVDEVRKFTPLRRVTLLRDQMPPAPSRLFRLVNHRDGYTSATVLCGPGGKTVTGLGHDATEAIKHALLQRWPMDELVVAYSARPNNY